MVKFLKMFSVLPCSDELYPEMKKLSSEITKVALELGGTCTGEHGVGLGKRDALKVSLKKSAVFGQQKTCIFRPKWELHSIQ